MKKIIISIIMVFLAILITANVSNATTSEEFTKRARKIDVGNRWASYSEIPLDTQSLYYKLHEKIYKYNIKTAEVERIEAFTYRGNDISFYTNGSIVYRLTKYSEDTTKALVEGYDVIKNERVYSQVFDTKQNTIGRTFAVDDNQRFYFNENIDDKLVFKSFDNKGKLIDTFSIPNSSYVSLNNVILDGKAINVTIDYYHEGYILIENGKFKTKLVQLHYSSRDPSWKEFSVNGKKYLIDNYGEIAEFTVSDEKVSYDIIYSTKRGTSEGSNVPAVLVEGKYLYTGSKNGKIIKLDAEKFEIVSYLEIGEDKIIDDIIYANGEIYIKYRQKSTEDDYLLKVTESEFTKTKTITVTNNVTTARTKEEITKEYLEGKGTYEGYPSDVYDEAPSTVQPYYEGKLKQKVLNDGLKQLNFYRWLAGLNKVTINTQYTQRSQKGAFIMAVNQKLTHYPSRPVGMTDEFYKEARAGVGAGSNYEGNICAGLNLPNSVLGWIRDTNNVQPNVGHRLSMLNPKANQVSFGYCNSYSACSIYTTSEDLENNEAFYAWPAAGYFPIEPTQKGEMWSVQLNSKYEINKNFEFKLIANNKEYVITKGIYYDSYSNAIYYKLPEELENYLYGVDSSVVQFKVKPDRKVEVKISGVNDDYGNNIVINYTTNYFLAEPIPATEVTVLSKVSDNMYQSLSKIEAEKGSTKVLEFRITPSNSTDDLIITVENPDIAKFDVKTKTVTLLKSGNTNLNISSKLTGKVLKTISIKVATPIETTKPVKTPTPTQTAKPVKTPTPTQTAKPVKTPTPTQTAKPVKTPTPTQTAKPVKTPTPTQTAKPVKTPTPTQTAKPVKTPMPTQTAKPVKTPTPTQTAKPINTPTADPIKYMLGDVTNDKKIKTDDALKVLRYSIGLEKFSKNQKLAADVNKDEKIDTSDAVKILRYTIGLEKI